jgi:hypothetical protein
MSDTPKKRGRPRTYIPSNEIKENEYTKGHAEVLLECLRKGFLKCQVFDALNISKATFYRWLDEYPEFKQAFELGWPKCESFWAKQLQEMTLARNDAGSKSCVMILNNNFGWGRDELRSGVTNNMQINVQGNMQIESKSSSELIELISANVESLQSKNVLPIEYQVLSDDQSDQSRSNEQD